MPYFRNNRNISRQFPRHFPRKPGIPIIVQVFQKVISMLYSRNISTQFIKAEGHQANSSSKKSVIWQTVHQSKGSSGKQFIKAKGHQANSSSKQRVIRQTVHQSMNCLHRNHILYNYNSWMVIHSF